jgi:hypothetical protein
MKRVIVRYRVKPEHVEENEQLIRGVYAELHAAPPDGLRYGTFKLDDGVSFVHIAEHAGDNPLRGVAAFRRFQEGIGARCEDPPVAAELHEIGSFRLFEDER